MSRLPTMLEILRERHGIHSEPPRSERLPLLLALLAFTVLLAFTI